jgi:hypothetical protein
MISSQTCNPLVITDALDVTFSPEEFPYPGINSLLLDTGFKPVSTPAGGTPLYRTPCGRGTVKIDQRARFARVSCSGAACHHLRMSGAWLEYLHVLSESPHCVTRLDAALDLSLDGADLIDSLRKLHKSGSVSLGRKAIKTSVILSVRDDGRESGTWYAGYGSSAKATAKVYDKALQMLQRFGVTIPPRGRVEVTAWKGYGATLGDAALPEAIFWHIASPALLQAPEGIPMWQPDTTDGWQLDRRELVPAQVLRNRLDNSGELAAMLTLAASFQGGLEYFRHLLNKRVTAAAASDDEAQSA